MGLHATCLRDAAEAELQHLLQRIGHQQKMPVLKQWRCTGCVLGKELRAWAGGAAAAQWAAPQANTAVKTVDLHGLLLEDTAKPDACNHGAAG